MRPSLIAVSLAAVASAAQGNNNNDKRQMSILPIGHTTVVDGKTIINDPLKPLVPQSSSTGGDASSKPPKVVTRPNPTNIIPSTVTTPTSVPPTTVATPTSAPSTTGGNNATITSTNDSGIVTTITSAVGGGDGGNNGGGDQTSDGGVGSTSSPDDPAPKATPMAGAALFAAVGIAMAL